MQKKSQIILLIFFAFAVFIINYPVLDKALTGFLIEEEFVFVERIIDGDTIFAGNESIRLLGVNAPERGETGYEEAKEFLEKEILGKEVKLEFVGERQDKYYRTLAYIFLRNENVNIKLVEDGFANYYFYSGKDKYSEELISAWDSCMEKNSNMCESSKDVCAPCIVIENNFIKNICAFECDITGWEIKGEGRNHIFFKKILSASEKESFDLDYLTDNSGGSLFLRDSEGKLVVWIN